MRRTALTAAAIGLGAVAPTAHAAIPPDRAATLTAATPSYTWDGPQASGYHVYWTAPLAFDPQKCSKEPETYCDATLVKLDAAPDSTATLTVTLSDYSSPAADFDVYIYTSDAAGNPKEAAPQTGCCEPAGTDENVSLANAEPGHYLVYVPYWLVNDASFKGTIKGADIVAPAPAPGPAPPPTAPQQPAGSAPQTLPLSMPGRATSRKRALPLKLTAKAEITNLQMRLTKGPRVFATRSIRRVAAGPVRTSLRVSRTLRAGRYRLAATGTVDGRRLTVRKSIVLSAARTR